ncbi:hypothetical protein [Streptomyces alboflavus]|uniref:hypothetical protein n=1 Tax=Streptomyces alboflavus TaxID=67267 RepID=UPI003AAC18CB
MGPAALAEGGEVADLTAPPQGRCLGGRHRLDRGLVQGDLVAVAGQFVVRAARLQPDVDTGRAVPSAPAGEPVRVQDQLGLHQDRAGDRRPRRRRCRVGVLRPLHPDAEERQGGRVAHITDHDAPARREQLEGLREHPVQIGGVGEVLHH